MQKLSSRPTTALAIVSSTQINAAHFRVWKRYTFCAFLALFTLSFSQPMVVTADSCIPLLADGGLEDGSQWHAKNSDGFPLLSRQLVHGGEQGAYLGGRNNIVDRLSTTLYLPPTDQSITLRFWWQLQSQERSTNGGDRLSVIAANAQGIPLQSLTELRGRDAVSDWQSISIDITALAGQTIQLQLLASTDDDQITDFFIDDIEIFACD